MVKKKTYMIISILFAIYAIGSVAYYYLFVYTKMSILIDSDLRYEYNGSKWIQETKINQLFEDYIVFQGEAELGKYDLRHSISSKRWAVYDKRNVKVQAEDIFAYKGNKKLKVIPFTEVEGITPQYIKVVKDYLVTKSLAITTEQCYSNSIEIDLDNDGIKEVIISINSKEDIPLSSSAFSSVIIIKNSKPYEVFYKNVKADLKYACGYPFLKKVIDINESGKYTMIFQITYFGNSKNCYSVVETRGKSFETKKQCY